MSILDLYPRKKKPNPRIRKFLFVRYSNLLNRPIPVCVEADNYDHAIVRLLAKWSFPWREWDFVEELEPEHDLGKMGETLKYERPQ